MSSEMEDFAIALAGEAKTHEDWLKIVNFGLVTLLKNQPLLVKIIVAEAAREAARDATMAGPAHNPGESTASHAVAILAQLRLKLILIP